MSAIDVYIKQYLSWEMLNGHKFDQFSKRLLPFSEKENRRKGLAIVGKF